MCLEVDVISVHWERTLKSRFLKDSINHIYQNGGECSLRHTIECYQFSESLQTTWAAAANHGRGLHFREMCCKTPCRADLLVGVIVCSMTGAFSSTAHQESMEDEANGEVDPHCFSARQTLSIFQFWMQWIQDSISTLTLQFCGKKAQTNKKAWHCCL